MTCTYIGPARKFHFAVLFHLPLVSWFVATIKKCKLTETKGAIVSINKVSLSLSLLISKFSINFNENTIGTSQIYIKFSTTKDVL